MKKWQSQVFTDLNTASAYAKDIKDEVSILGGRVWAEGAGTFGNIDTRVCIKIPDDCEPTGFMGHLGSQLIFTEV